jgi:PncC family amidohydrolase
MSTPQTVHQALIEKEKTLALAESCTGGHLAAKLTSIPDASKYFQGSLITYSNSLKEKLLNVNGATLLEHGAVSRETANEMVRGVLNVSQADYGIAITGIAGPSGGTQEKPVGTVYIAVGESGKKPHIIRCQFEGERKQIVEATCERALQELLSILRN